MGSGAKRFRVQDLGLSGRDALLLLDALGGEAADLDVAAEELSPGTLAATILFAVRTATGELRPGLAGSAPAWPGPWPSTRRWRRGSAGWTRATRSGSRAGSPASATRRTTGAHRPSGVRRGRSAPGPPCTRV